MIYDDRIKALEEQHGVKIEILSSYDVENPRNFGQDSVLVTALNRHHIIGDNCRDADLPLGCPSIEDAFHEHLKQNKLGINNVIYLPVYAYLHGFMTIATTPYECRFDSGQAGYIYLIKKDARERLGVKKLSKENKDTIYQQLAEEIALLDSYICNEVFTFTIDGEYPDETGEFYGTDLDKSGLFGSLEEALSKLPTPA